LDGTNFVLILEEFGKKVAHELLEHYKNFTVSEGMGGLKLLRDLTEFRDTAGKLFNSETVLEKFELLKDLAHIHLVAPENVKNRADFKSTWIGKYI